MDDVFEGDEEVEGELMDKIYDEIGLDIGTRAAAAPSTHHEQEAEVDDIVERMLRQAN